MEYQIDEATAMTEAPQLSFTLNNPDAPNTIYLGDGSSVNKLTFTIKTNTPATFNAGEPVVPADAGNAKGSLLYLDLSPLGIKSTDFGKIECTVAGWNWAAYDDTTLCFAPIDDVSLGSGSADAIDIAIDNLIVQKASSSSENLNVKYYRVDPISSGSLPGLGAFKIVFQNPAGGHKDLKENIVCALSPTNIVNTSIQSADPVTNAFSLVFSAGSVPLEVDAGPDTKFQISFVYADVTPGYGALCTPQQASKVTVKQGINASAWKITANTSNENPSWTLVPPDGRPIIGTGATSSLQINVDDLVTYFQAGSTIMYVQYENIPGYDDGSYSLLINKVPHVSIENLTVSPNPSVLNDGTVEVEISWSEQSADSLTLMPFYEDVTGKTGVTQTLSGSTEITLVATGSGSPANRVFKTTKANVLPVINSFKGTPTNIYARDFPHDAQFYWDVDTDGQVFLENGSGLKEPVAKSATANKSLYGPNIWSVSPENSQDYYKLKRNLSIRSFQTKSISNPLPFSPSAIAASPSAPLIIAINSADNKVYILNNLTYDNYTGPIATGSKPNDVIFSEDGHFMFVTDETDKNVSVFSVQYDNTKANYQFALEQVIVLPSSPQRIGITNDEAYVFITGIKGDDGDFSVLAQSDPGPYALSKTVDVGKVPQGFAVNPAGAQIYVANSADNSISVIGYSPISDSFENVRTIENVSGSPCDIALGGPDSLTLVVATKTTNQIVIMSPNDNGNSSRQLLDVGISPARLATIPGYAFVANSGSKDVSLLSTYGGIGQSKVLEKSIPVGDTPIGITTGGSDNMLFVANSKSSSIEALNLINYEAKGAAVPVGKAGNNAAVLSDGKNVLAWCNVKSVVPRSGGYDKGIFIYDTNSGTVDRKMDSDEMIDCIYYPDSTEKTAYVSVNSNNFISVLETQHYIESSKIPIPDGEGGVKRNPENLAITPDGKILSVLTSDDTNNYDLLLYQVDISNKTYTKIADLSVFNGNGGSNTVLMSINYDASSIAIVSATNQKVWLVNQSGGAYKVANTELKIKLLAQSMVINPEGNHLYILSSLNTETAIDVVDLQAMTISNYPLPPSYSTLINLQDMVISPDGQSLYITDADIAGIRVVSTKTLRFVQTLEYEEDVRYPTGITITPDGMNLYFTGSNSGNLLWIGQIGYNQSGIEYAKEPTTNFLMSLDAASDPYNGIFIRDYVGETTTDHSGSSWTNSPDIICNGTSPIKDTATLTNQSNYDQGLPAPNTQTPLTPNNVYVRGINEADGPIEATVYFYYVDTTIVLWPQNWKTEGIDAGGTSNSNGLPFNATTKGEIIATNPHFLWTPPRTGVHYCMVGWVANPGDDSPPKLYDIGTVNDMGKFIMDHPNIGWRNLVEVDATVADLQGTAPISGATFGGIINIGVQLQNLPVGGEFEFSCQGDTPENTVIYPRTKISNPNASATVQVNWTPGYDSAIVFKYYKMDTTPPDGANIIPVVGTRTAGSDFMAYAKKVAPQHVGKFECYKSPAHLIDCMEDSATPRPIEELFIVGSVVFNLKS